MGRPTKDIKRDNMITLRLTNEEKEMLKNVSESLKLSYTDIFIKILSFIYDINKNSIENKINENK